jgi:hypothetical protein
MSYVPPDAYHVTLVNRTHFDTQANKSDVRPLSAKEKEQVDQIVLGQRCGSVDVRYRGLLATKSGRLMAPAFVEDARIFRLKEALRAGVVGHRNLEPVLAENYPLHTLTKLGHIVVPLKGAQVRKFADWLRAEGANVDVSVTFRDVYTQLGRISL